MQIRYPDVTEEVYRLHYLKQDRAQCRKVMRVVMWASLPLAYVDFAFLSFGWGFFSLLFLRTLIFAYSWRSLKKTVSIVDPQALNRQVFRWSSAVLLMQFVSNVSLPRDYFGHYLVDTWICVIFFIVIPLPLRVLRPAIFGFTIASLGLLLYKTHPVFAYAVSVMVILPAGAYTGHAISSYIHRYRRKILSAEIELERKESTDPVTGIANRREFMRVSESELLRHARLGKSLSLLIVDLDQFKKIRENYGPVARDIVLVEITKRVKRATRSYDCIARYGTEEFCVLLPEATAEDAARIAARTRATIVAMPVAVSGRELKVNANIGIATMLDGDTTETMLRRADEVLVESKAKKT